MRRYAAYFCVASALLLFAACSSEPETPEAADTPAAADPAPPPSSPISGSWVLNVAKSTYSPADLAPKETTVKYEVTGDEVKGTTDGTDSKGRKTHSEYTAKFDGVAVPSNNTVDGKPGGETDATAWKKIDDHNYELTQSLKGKPVYTFKIVVAPDGKSRTSTQTGKNAAGQTVNNTLLFEK